MGLRVIGFEPPQRRCKPTIAHVSVSHTAWGAWTVCAAADHMAAKYRLMFNGMGSLVARPILRGILITHNRTDVGGSGECVCFDERWPKGYSLSGPVNDRQPLAKAVAWLTVSQAGRGSAVFLRPHRTS